MQKITPVSANASKLILSVTGKQILITLSVFIFNFIFASISLSQTLTCSGSPVLTAVTTATCTPGTTFNISGTGTGPTMSSCSTNGTAANNWAQFVANGPTATISYDPANNRDAMIYAYSGACPSGLVQIGCKDDNGNGTQEDLSLSGLTAGNTYYVRIVRYGSTGNMNGSICVASQNTITTSAIGGSSFCLGSSVSVPFTSTGTFSGNTYTAQLSDAAGSFSSPTSIGTLVSNANSGSISATISTGGTPGTGYRVRVVANGPTTTGADNGTNFAITALPQGSFSGNSTCSGGTPQLTFTATSGTGSFTVIYNDGVANRTQTGVVSGTGFAPFTTPGSTTNYTLVSVTDNNSCPRTTGFTDATATITIGSTPTITSASTAYPTCYNTSFQNSNLAYSATTNSPTNYTITWSAAGLSAGLVNTGSIALTGSPLSVPQAAGATAGTYTGTLIVTNAAGCPSASNSFTLTISPLPTITSAATATAACFSSTAQNSALNYSATTNSPTLYSIIWNATAISAGLVNVTNAALTAGSVTVPVAANVATATYTGTLKVTTASSCVSTGNSFTLTVNATPQGSLTGNIICSGGTGQLTYTASSGAGPYTVIYYDGLSNRTKTGVVSGTPFNTFINPLSTTNYTLISVTDNNSCARTSGFTSGTGTVTVGNTPVNKAPSAASSSICSGTGTNIVISSAQSGVDYQLRNNTGNVLVGSAITGPGTVNLPTGNLITNTTFNVLATETATGCYLQMSPTVSVTVNTSPTVTSATTATSKCYSTSAQNSSLAYSATTGSPINYTITWDAAAISAGLANVGSTLLVVSPVTVPVAAGVAAGTYNGTFKVGSLNGCTNNPGNSFTLTISAYPSMTSAAAASFCSGGTVNIPLTSTVASTYTWIGAVNANITGESTSTQTTSTLNNTLTNTSGAVQVVNYTVTPTSTVAACTGAAQTVLVTVNPIPVTTALPATQTICSGNVIGGIVLSSSNSVSGTTYTWSRTTPSGITGTVPTSGTSVPDGSTITGSFTNSNASATNVTFTVNSTSPAGCPGSAANATVTVNKPVVITTQPTDQSGCSGTSESFTVTATGTSVTYQWRKGTTNLANGGSISGATTATLTINPAAVADNATDYNCMVTSAACTSVISDYVSLTITNSATTPTAQPTTLTFPTVNTTSILGSFVASASATNYLVIRKTTNSAPTAPVNGITYMQGASALTGYVDYVGTTNVFTSNGLSPNTTYYYWIYAYNTGICGTSPLYYSTSPLAGNATTATTVACGTVTTLYWGGLGSVLTGSITSGTDFNTAANWSTTSPAYTASPAGPTQCNTVSMAFKNNATVTLSANASVYNLTYTVSTNSKVVKLSTEGKTLIVNGDAVVDVLSGNDATAIYIGENGSGSGIVDFKANFRIGETYFTPAGFFSDIPTSFLVGNVNSKIIFRGDVLFGRTARFNLPSGGTYPPSYPLASPPAGTTPGTIEFDGMGLQQVLWNNDYYYDNFFNMVVGNVNQPYVRHVTGTYTPDNILNNFTINNGCTVDLGTSQWIREQQGGTFTMNGTAKLILGNNTAVKSSANTGVVATGSNFPGGFTTMNISTTSTIEYNAGSSLTQTVYGTPSVGTLTYGNLILSNGPTTGTANKISTSTITVAGATTISNATIMTLGAGLVSNGAASVNSGGRLECNTNIVSGSGSFTLLTGGTLAMGSTAGITSSGATGNVQTTTRTFGTAGNYVYNGASAQATGNGLPKTMNDLTILNTGGVTMNAASANYKVAGTLRLTSGPLVINGDTLSINAVQRTSGTLSGSSTSSVGITGTGVPLFFTTGSGILKNLFLNTGATGSLQTPLDITAGSSAGSVAVASGATLTTVDNLVLKSDANGTARISEIPVDGSGNALGTISGKVQIERFIPARRAWRLMTVPIQASGAPTFNAAWQEGVVNSDYVYANNNNPNPGYGMHITGGSSASGFDQSYTGNASIKSYNPATAAWAGIANTTTAKPTDLQGYMVFVRGNRGTQISLNTSAPLSTDVLRAIGNVKTGRQAISIPASAGSYSVVGNPFASAINFKSVTVSANITGSSFLLWDPKLTGVSSVGAFQYFTQLGGAGSDYQVTPGGGSYGASLSINNIIQSGQAFMVQRTTGSGTVTINENTKVGSSSSTVFRPASAPNVGYVNTIMSFINPDSSTSIVDGVLTAFDNNFADEIDFEDVRKMSNIAENFGIEKNGVSLQIEKRQPVNSDDTIFYKMNQLYIRNYRLELSLKNISPNVTTAYLQDSRTQASIPLNLDGYNTYDFNVVNEFSSYNPYRFKVVFKTSGVLPVTFTNIMANRQNKNIAVDWKVDNEINMIKYEVEKSTDGRAFTKINTTAATGNGAASVSYRCTDENVTTTDNYYRIKSISSNSSIVYSRIVKVSMGNLLPAIKVYPNPVTDGVINLELTNLPAGIYTARLINEAGQVLLKKAITHIGGNSVQSISPAVMLPTGNYQLELIGTDNHRYSLTVRIQTK